MNPATPAFQDAIWAESFCWGCGPSNEQGLRIQSYWDGDESICSFTPRPYHAAGPREVLNGGIIASLIDCHCVCTAIAAHFRAEGREIGAPPPIWCVTGSLEVRYLAPTPLGRAVTLRARVVEVRDKKTVVACSLSAGGRERARGQVIAIRVGFGWLRRALE